MAPKRGTDWFVRIHRTYEEIKPWVENLSDKAAKVIVYQHDSDEEVARTHCHLLIMGYTTSDETMKMQLTKVLGERLKGQKDWAWDPVVRDESAAIQYMSKRDLQPVYNWNYEVAYVAECSAKYLPPDEHKNREKVQYKLIPEKPEVALKRQNDLLDEMAKRMRTYKLRKMQDYPLIASMQPQIADEVFQWNTTIAKDVITEVLNENRQICGRFKIRDYHDTLMMRMDRKGYCDALTDMLRFKNTFV